MTYELALILFILFYTQIATIVYMSKKIEANLYDAIKTSKSPRGRSLISKKEANIKSRLFLKSIFWPALFVLKDDKETKK